jgi:hypothetical protein
LNKKIWNLRHSYVNAISYYNRGIALTDDDHKDELKVIHLFQYEFYSEMTFYYLISTRDIIFQIINLAFDLGLSEDSKKAVKGKPAVSMRSIIDKVEANNPFQLYDIMSKMREDLTKANDVRNSMTHSFSKLDSDRRSIISNDDSTYSAGTGKRISYEEQVDIMLKSMQAIKMFFDSIKVKLIENGVELE